MSERVLAYEPCRTCGKFEVWRRHRNEERPQRAIGYNASILVR